VVSTAGRGGTWARGDGVELVLAPGLDVDADAGLRRALTDGIERGYAGTLPPIAADVERYALRAEGETVGVLLLRRDCPVPGEGAVLAVAIDPARRGRAYASKALLAAERRLRVEGVERVAVRVPRTNGRGLYFMLRAGFAATSAVDGDDATWFRRVER
jgi:ribosomal protein S18 acetylase RimI-like enzyme